MRLFRSRLHLRSFQISRIATTPPAALTFIKRFAAGTPIERRKALATADTKQMKIPIAKATPRMTLCDRGRRLDGPSGEAERKKVSRVDATCLSALAMAAPQSVSGYINFDRLRAAPAAITAAVIHAATCCRGVTV